MVGHSARGERNGAVNTYIAAGRSLSIPSEPLEVISGLKSTRALQEDKTKVSANHCAAKVPSDHHNPPE